MRNVLFMHYVFSMKVTTRGDSTKHMVQYIERCHRVCNSTPVQPSLGILVEPPAPRPRDDGTLIGYSAELERAQYLTSNTNVRIY